MNLMVVSGGQTGADRGGLDAAITLGIPHRGWCPRGRKAEDGIIPIQYRMVETESSGYPERTELNVFDSHITVVVCQDVRKSPGSKLTLQFCEKHRRPYHVFDPFKDERKIITQILSMAAAGARILNVAGSRESKCPGIQAQVSKIMQDVLWELKNGK